MVKKQITTNLLVTSLIFSNISVVNALEEDSLNETSSQNIVNSEYELDSKVPIEEDGLNSDSDTNNNLDENFNNSNGQTNENIDSDLGIDTSNPDSSEDNVEGDSIEDGVNEDNEDEENVEDMVILEDSNLISAINLHLGKSDLSSPILKKEADTIVELDLSNKNISNLSGIEHFSNIKNLDLSNNNIKDISMLSNLSNLIRLNASHNNIIDIRPLKNLNLDEANLSNQEFFMDSQTAIDNNVTIKNPIKIFEGSLIERLVISHNGFVNNDNIVWNNLEKGDFNLEVQFEKGYEKFIFSGRVVQPVSNKDSIANDLNIDLNLDSSDWTNNSVRVSYAITGDSVELIDKIELPNNNSTLEHKGSFLVSDNGVYDVDVFLNNGKKISKSIEVKNIDKEKPNLNMSKKMISKDMISINLEATDSLSGIDYILLPNGEKIHDNKARFETSYNNKDLIFRAYDIAGNYFESQINIEDSMSQKPTINASNKQIVFGSTFNPLKGVSAKDYKGKNITNKIIVIKNEVDVNSLGEYPVTYKVTDDYGNESIKSIFVEVIDKDVSLDNSKDNTEASTIIDKSAEDNNKGNSVKDDKKGYLSIIALSIMSGFAFLFRSGKDNF